MVSTPRLRQKAALWTCTWVLACGGRSVPPTWPAAAAASPSAAEAPAAEVTRALDGGPPLPGDEAEGWAGLGAAPAGHDAHAGHETHAGHGAHAGHEGPAPQGGHEHGEPGVVYSCPMHADVVSDHPGQCPRCGMKLVKPDAPK